MKNIFYILFLLSPFFTVAKQTQKLEELTFETLEHGTFALNFQHKNKATVILFSDSLCPYMHLPNCEQKLTAFKQFKAQHQQAFNWLQVVKGYYVDENHVRRYLKNFGLTLPTIWDQNNHLFSHYKVFGSPYLLILDKQGNLLFRGENFSTHLSNALNTHSG